jgi:LacI family transcriptional regulator
LKTPTDVRKKKRRVRAPSKAPARLSDVAALAGVSAGTVSRVFSAPHLVAPETATAVRAAIDKLGWISHGPARALASHKSRTIGVVIPNLSNPVFAQMIYAIQDSLIGEGYTLVLNCSEYDQNKALIGTRSMLERGIDGLILLGENFPDALWHLLQVQRVPNLVIYSFRSSADRQFVGVDNVRAARAAAVHLLELGHRDFVILSQDTTNNDRVAARLYGFTEATRDYGIGRDKLRLIQKPWSIQSGYDAVMDLIDSQGLPTAILCTNDFHAVGAIAACRERGVSVPDELSVIGFDDLEMAAYLSPPLTTVRVPAAEIGLCAAKAMVGLLERNEPLCSVEFEASLIVRRSTAPPKLATASH